MNDDDFLGELGRALGHEPEREPDPDRVAAVRAAAARLADGDAQPAHGASPRRIFITGGIAAGIGGLAGYVVRDAGVEAPPAAAPVETVTLEAVDGVAATGGLINHTWGTELLLDVTGLVDGTPYAVEYLLADGSTVGAGSLLGVADVLMKCRFNAAPLRADVRRIEVRDPDGRPVVSSELPPVDA